MRSCKFLSIPAIATIVCLLVMPISTAPTLASESLRVNPTKGVIGDEIDVIGSGYELGDRAYIYFSSRKARVGDDIEELDVWEEVKAVYATEKFEDGGDIDTSFEVPDELNEGGGIEEVRAGQYFVYTTYTKEGKILAKDEFTVIGITVVYPTRSTVGTEVMIKGIGFRRNEYIEVFYDSDEIEIASGNSETDENGDFTLTIVIPPCPTGAHTIAVEIDKDKGTADFTVEPDIFLSVVSGMFGDRVTVTGTGFGSEVQVDITLGDKKVATVPTDGKGSFAIDFNVPSVQPGTYDIVAKDTYHNSTKTEFTLTPDISISPVTSQSSPGHVGMDVTIRGSGFIPKHEITVTYADKPLGFTTSEADGSFTHTLNIPKSEAGKHTITASDGTNSNAVTFIMECEVPATPQLLLPPTNTKPQRPITFDWKDTTDPSGVTYILQIASDEGFDDILIEKQGLVESKYTMSQTEDKMLESTKKAANYWWRVKAIDGASNNSGWSSARPFNIGIVSAMVDWLKYLLIGLAVVALSFIAFFLGRRTSHAR